MSRSFDSRDDDLVQAVLGFCEAAGFPPIRTERASRNVPREKIRDAISEAHAFLGILTANPDAARVPREWVITEIGMAEYAKLPILLFLERGVQFEPADHITSYATFDRDDVLGLCRSVVSCLVELREDSRIARGAAGAEQDRPYRFIADDVQMEILADGRLRQERHIEVQSLIPSLEAVQPISRVITTSRSLGYFDSEFEFVATSDNDLRFEIRRNDPAEIAYQVFFGRPLHRNEVASFTVNHTCRGSVPLTREALARSSADDYIQRSPVARQGHAIKVPTERLTISLRFPDSYGIASASPRLNVTLRDRVGQSSQAQSELDRIRSNFRVRHNRLELEVEYPELDHAYYFEWTPPARADLSSELFGGD